jgi:cobalamin biosynthetic protein CobC
MLPRDTASPANFGIGTLAHGGDLSAARKLFPGAPEPFIDLSTGINPFPYPLPQLDPALFARLPEAAALARLTATAAKAFGAPSPAHVVASPGLQILLPLVASLAWRGRAAVLGPTYAEHARAAALAGHDVQEVTTVDHLGGARLAVVVNPNNPDGRIVGRDTLRRLAQRLAPGLLVVDEAFMEAGPADASVAPDVAMPNLVVLRSLGKFFGLAGVRLGFALAAPELAARIAAALGPWAVSGPALAIGAAALADATWIAQTRERLADAAHLLDALLAQAGLTVVGGTSLFRLVRTPAAGTLFYRLGCAGVFVRRFDEHPDWLRFGLPADEAAWDRLSTALMSVRAPQLDG